MDPYIGEIRLFAGSWAPEQWMFCDGSLLAVADYEQLFSLIGTKYGGDGQSTFALPDLRGRVPVGQGPGPGLTVRTLGQKGGSETVVMTIDALAPHAHPLKATTHAASTKDPSPNVGFSQIADGAWFYAKTDVQPAPQSFAMNTGAVTEAGGGQGHNNLMGTVALNYIICMVGLYPPRP